MYDVAALGELLIDFTPAGKSESGNALFERNPGGGPPNVLAAVSRLGGECAFMGMVGDDAFGRFLKGVLEQNAINSDGLKFTDKMNTTLAIVQLDEKGDRSFGFYGMPGPETHMRESDLEPALISSAKIFHFSSLLLHDEAARSVSLAAVRHAKHNGVLISYDPNYRPPLWSSAQAAKEILKIGLEYADILKISETELELLTGECDPETGGRLLLEKGIRLVLVTLGPHGCFYLSSAGS
ncbi:MAG: carbohydrate kinase, partial [Clostridia bacterium]|nr:carbohydrate kinase [Clostridia bacterium]